MRASVAPLLGDVLVRRDPAAVAHRVMQDRDHAPVLELDDIDVVLAAGNQLQAPLDIGARPHHRMDAAIDAILQDLLERSPRLHEVARQAVEGGVAVVADDELAIAIEHAEPVGHVVDGGNEARVVQLELPLALLERPDLVDLRGDVLVGDDPAGRGLMHVGRLYGAPADLLFVRAGLGRVATGMQPLPKKLEERVRRKVRVIAGGDRQRAHVAEGHAFADLVAGQPVDLAVAAIPKQQAELAVPHGKAVGHAFQGGVEQHGLSRWQNRVVDRKRHRGVRSSRKRDAPGRREDHHSLNASLR